MTKKKKKNDKLRKFEDNKLFLKNNANVNRMVLGERAARGDPLNFHLSLFDSFFVCPLHQMLFFSSDKKQQMTPFL